MTLTEDKSIVYKVTMKLLEEICDFSSTIYVYNNKFISLLYCISDPVYYYNLAYDTDVYAQLQNGTWDCRSLRAKCDNKLLLLH